MKTKTQFATYTFRSIIGVLGIGILLFAIQQDSMSFFSWLSFSFILVLFLGYAFGKEKQLHNFFINTQNEDK